MDIENEIFKKSHVNIESLCKFGFIKKKDEYYYFKTILDNSFQVQINISNKGILSGKIIDLETNEEYINYRVSSQIGSFVSKVRDAYKKILLEIRNNCFTTDYFLSKQANRIAQYILDTYQDKPEFLWEKFSGYGVFRNANHKKWYAIIMNINQSKLDIGHNEIEILNIKLNSDKVNQLIKKKGFYKAYHMNKKDWITITLDDTLSDEVIISLLNESYSIINQPVYWIVPANPNYYDIVHSFQDTDEIIWKQSSDIHVDDIVYIYVASPYSRIMFQCKAIEVNIPYSYQSDTVSMNRVMRLKLLKKFDSDIYHFNYLNSLGIKSLRGPRKISDAIAKKIC